MGSLKNTSGPRMLYLNHNLTMREFFGHSEVPPKSEKPENIESIERPFIREEAVDAATFEKIKEAEMVMEMTTFLNDRLNDPDEKVLGNMQLGEFLNVLEREREDFLAAGERDQEEAAARMFKNFKDYPRLYNGLPLGETLMLLALRWTELKVETEKKLGHKI